MYYHEISMQTKRIIKTFFLFYNLIYNTNNFETKVLKILQNGS
jgi:hypothetical protein